MNIRDTSILKPNKTINTFKNPYCLTFFNVSLARKYFNQSNRSINKSKDSTSTVRTPNNKRSFISKLGNSRDKLHPKSKTPKLQPTQKIKTIEVRPIGKKTKKEYSASMCYNKKENGFVSISIEKPQSKSYLKTHPNATTTRNSNIPQNVIVKENTITGINIKVMPQPKKTNDRSIKENNNILTANSLPKDVRIKMLNKDNAIKLGGSEKRKENSTYNGSFFNKKVNPSNAKQIEINGRYANSTTVLPSSNKFNTANDDCNIYNSNSNSNNQSSSKRTLQLEYNSKNRYRNLINSYLISEDI